MATVAPLYEIWGPSPPLRPFIECFWFLHTAVVGPAPLEEIVFTDARADLMLCFGSPYLRRNTGPHAQTHLMRVSHLDAQRAPLAEQEQIVAEVERRLSVVAETEAQVEADLKRAERLRQSILKQAFAGKLVPQDPEDEPASVLLERLCSQRRAGADTTGRPEKVVQLRLV